MAPLSGRDYPLGGSLVLSLWHQLSRLRSIKIKGQWVFLYRAITKSGDTIDFYLSSTRNAKAGSYSHAIRELKTEDQCSLETEHRQVKYLNNVVETDHGKLKRLI